MFNHLKTNSTFRYLLPPDKIAGIFLKVRVIVSFLVLRGLKYAVLAILVNRRTFCCFEGLIGVFCCCFSLYISSSGRLSSCIKFNLVLNHC